MKSVYKIAFIGIIFFLTINTAQAKKMQPHYVTQAKQTALSPTQALALLEKGNARYTSNKTISYNQRKIGSSASKKGQAPYAFVFSCVDSRSIPEVIFDQPVGALFVSRIAGNVVSDDVLGSLEFATQYAGTKLVIVMGHTQCGAVAGACQGVNEPENLDDLLDKIKPAVKTIKKQDKKKFNCDDQQTIDAIAKQNVINQIHEIYDESPATIKLVKQNKIEIVGAMHDLTTGKVTFFDENGNALQ